MKRAIIALLDGVGVGELPDAERYGDEGSNTLGNLSRAVRGLRLPNLERLGLGNIIPIAGVRASPQPSGSYGKMAELSPGKDSTTGHWELAGVVLERPFPLYPDGFPKGIIEPFEKAIGRRTLGNYPASGTEIIKKLGEEHLRTGFPIVYTSADSVFQIAAHEEVVPIEELYSFCETARSILKGEHAVARVIARPFLGEPGSFSRTEKRRDYSLPPPEPTILDLLKEKGYSVVGIGKIDDLFANRGLTRSYHSVVNMECCDHILTAMNETESGLIFANLVEFDMVWGHRNNPRGFGEALEAFDSRLSEIVDLLTSEDVLFITADHGNDPTTPSTDHSREYIPVLAYGEKIRSAVDLGTRESFADLGATIGDIFGISLKNGKSFLPDITTGEM